MASQLVATRYELRERIGAGGGAVVYRAFDRRLERDVALKLLRPEYASDHEFVTRFQREARAAASLNHPNIVRVDDYGQHDQTAFIAMEYVDGPNLKEYVKVRGPLDPAEAVRIARDLLSALGAAHRQGLVHRDVKPQNVLLGRDGGSGELSAKLTDFGIARMPAATQLTQLGTTIGTAAYVAPEQASGTVVGPAADLYGVGLLLYEMLTGRPPFEGDTPAAVLYRHVHEPPRPPSQLRPGLSPALEAVVMRALEKDPARRFASAEEMSQALSQALAGPSPVAPVPTAPLPTAASTLRLPTTAPVVVEPRREPRRAPLWPLLLLGALIALGLLLALLRFSDRGAGVVPAAVAAPTATAPTTPAVAAPSAAAVEPTTAPARPSPPPAPAATAPPAAAPAPPTATPRPPPTAPPTRAPQPPTSPAAGRPETAGAGAVLVPPKAVSPSGAVVLEDTAFQGGFRNGGGSIYRRRSATWIYGARTPYSTMAASFDLPSVPAGGAVLTITGLDSETAGKTPISLAVNGRELFRGPSPFADDTHDPDFQNAAAPWSEQSWEVPADALRAGTNTITIRNLADSAEVGVPPFFMLDRAVVQFR
jgi:serine/threonine-protein kinase